LWREKREVREEEREKMIRLTVGTLLKGAVVGVDGRPADHADDAL
jgi:hypothetical protein